MSGKIGLDAIKLIVNKIIAGRPDASYADEINDLGFSSKKADTYRSVLKGSFCKAEMKAMIQ